MKLTAQDIIRKPRITEKSVYLQNDHGKYTFEVHPSATKTQVKEAVQALFDVTVTAVRTFNCDGKARRTRMGVGRTAAWKKAIVTLADGQQIEGV